jgi:hypothetical protein
LSRLAPVEIHGLLNEGDSADLLLPGKWHEPPAVWTTMLQVDVATGEVLVNRLGEVMGNVFASYSRGSAFEEQQAKRPGYDSAGTLSRRRILGHAGRRARRR